MKNKIYLDCELDVVFSWHYLCRSSEGGSGDKKKMFPCFRGTICPSSLLNDWIYLLHRISTDKKPLRALARCIDLIKGCCHNQRLLCPMMKGCGWRWWGSLPIGCSPWLVLAGPGWGWLTRTLQICRSPVCSAGNLQAHAAAPRPGHISSDHQPTSHSHSLQLFKIKSYSFIPWNLSYLNREQAQISQQIFRFIHNHASGI